MAAWRIQVFFDGDCPLCLREIRMLERLNRGRGRIRFTDIAEPGFSASEVGLTHAQLMDRIHGRFPDGRWIEGVEVFRQIWTALGWSWLVFPTRLPGISHGLNLAYGLFAKNRLKLTGRCQDGHCELPSSEGVTP